MLKPFNRHPRDSTLFQFTTRCLQDFIDPDHLLVRIDEQFDFGKLVALVEDRYCPDNGRPAVLRWTRKMEQVAKPESTGGHR